MIIGNQLFRSVVGGGGLVGERTQSWSVIDAAVRKQLIFLLSVNYSSTDKKLRVGKNEFFHARSVDRGKV